MRMNPKQALLGIGMLKLRRVLGLVGWSSSRYYCTKQSISSFWLRNVGLWGGRPAIVVSAREFASGGPKQAAPKDGRPRKTRPLKPPLAIKKPVEGWDIISDDEEDVEHQRKSKGQLKREGIRALHMARVLATLSPSQIKNAIKWAFLPDQILEATLTVQKMETSGVREGKRRQYNYIAGLLRNADPNVAQFVINSLRDGETQILRRDAAARAPEREKHVKCTTERWIQGLLDRDESITKEVYSFPPELLDREELRRLIRDVRGQVYMRDKLDETDRLRRLREKDCAKVTRSLSEFLAEIALKDYNAKANTEETAAEESEAEVHMQTQPPSN